MTGVTTMQLPVLFAQDSGAGKTDFTSLPIDLYSVIRGCMPIFCVDIVAIDKNRKLFYLAVRRRAPHLASGLAFGVGLFGLSLAAAVWQGIRDVKVGEVITGWISRKS